LLLEAVAAEMMMAVVVALEVCWLYLELLFLLAQLTRQLLALVLVHLVMEQLLLLVLARQLVEAEVVARLVEPPKQVALVVAHTI